MRLNIDAPNVVKTIKTNIEKIKNRAKPQAKPETEAQKRRRKRKIQRIKKKVGTLGTDGLKKISLGLQALETFVYESGDNLSKSLLIGDKDVSIYKELFFEYYNLIGSLLRSEKYLTRSELEEKQRLDFLREEYEIMQAARDGVLNRKEKRTEKIDGVETTLEYDKAMSEYEASNNVREYYRLLNSTEFSRISNYFLLGVSLAGAIGELVTRKSVNEKDDFGKLLTFGTISVSGIRLISDLARKSARERCKDVENERNKAQRDFLHNEQVSKQAIEDSIYDIEEKTFASLYETIKTESLERKVDLAIDLVVAMAYGLYISRNIQKTPDGKIDGMSLAKTLISLRSATKYAQSITRGVGRINNMKIEYKAFEDARKNFKHIESQMEEKVHPLVGTDKPFDRIEIKNFEGYFYPKQNYQTGEIEYGSKLVIPEFSIKRGETVLLSGDSGAGKSTFLRLLKRGDINNRDCILLDEEKRVDNLGSEFISFRPAMNLGDEENVLYQITGKKNITDLSSAELLRMDRILSELGLDFPNRFDTLATRTFSEFSTGQQRRLALSKLFYRINDGTSVIIVDEPVRKCWR